ncbi:MAG TPA: type I methionyl aminopeptidase [Candidatus Omnitrophota bacterium]|nr:type I methionyl aminopeptidase [Candidatus Omnitrophota bacterium]
MIPIKNASDLELMRQAGAILARIMVKLQEYVKPGITTAQINEYAEELMRTERVLAAFKGYRGYPASICTSVNEVVVHGIPGERKLLEGDLISLDAGIIHQGVFSDAAVTVGVGKISAKIKKLIDITRQALNEGIRQMQVDNRLTDIAAAVQSCVERNGFSVVRQFVGHGIGRAMHEEPEIPNFGKPHRGPLLKPGMVFAIEPMVNLGTWECEILEDGWTAVTLDRQHSAHFEHTVALTDSGPQLLTAY